MVLNPVLYLVVSFQVQKYSHWLLYVGMNQVIWLENFLRQDAAFDIFSYLVLELSEIFGTDFIYESGSDQLPPLPFKPYPQKSVLYQELCKINLYIYP